MMGAIEGRKMRLVSDTQLAAAIHLRPSVVISDTPDASRSTHAVFSS
jgi:hypothetical protein